MVSEENNKRITKAKNHIKEILKGLETINNLDEYGKKHMIPPALQLLNRTLNKLRYAKNQNAYNKNVVFNKTYSPEIIRKQL